MGPAGWSGLPGHWRRRKAPRSLLHLVITGPEKHPTPSLFTNPLTVTQSGLSLCKHHSLLLIFFPPSCLMFLWPGRGRATACYGGLPVQTAAHRSHCRLHYTAEWRKTHTGLIFLKICICINLKMYFSKNFEFYLYVPRKKWWLYNMRRVEKSSRRTTPGWSCTLRHLPPPVCDISKATQSSKSKQNLFPVPSEMQQVVFLHMPLCCCSSARNRLRPTSTWLTVRLLAAGQGLVRSELGTLGFFLPKIVNVFV